jgi:hypothetical protein
LECDPDEVLEREAAREAEEAAKRYKAKLAAETKAAATTRAIEVADKRYKEGLPATSPKYPPTVDGTATK